jgi:branched-chain amino acid transport system permease protein
MSVATATASRRRSIQVGPLAERAIAIGLLGALGIWLIRNFIDGPTAFINNSITGLSNGATYALIALGYTLVYGIIELINFAHGDLFMLGTLVASHMMVNWLGLTDPTVAGFAGMALTIVVVMIFCATINTSAEYFAYRRLRNAPKLAPLITAVGLSFIFQNIGQLINGAGQKYPETIFTNASGADIGFSIGDVTIKWGFVVTVSVTIVVLLVLTYIVKATRQGKAMRATAQDQDGARLMGINVNRTISFTFALGGAMAGVAAVLYMETQGTTRYDAGFQLGLIAFTAAVLGGIGNLTGAVIGAVLIGLIQAYNDAYGIGSQWGNTVVFSILIFVLVFKPEGLLGRRTTEKV